MKRYILDAYIEQLCDGPVCNADMDECEHGEWVRYADAQAEIERLKISHRRYETVRRMNVPQFEDVFRLNISTGKPFDKIIDDLAPFYC